MSAMAKHFVSVCIFCFLCATHSPCASHAETVHRRSQHFDNKRPFKDPSSWRPLPEEEPHAVAKRSVDLGGSDHGNGNDEYLKSLFDTYGDGNSISLESFQRLMRQLDLLDLSHRLHHAEEELETKSITDSHKNNNQTKCVDRSKIYDSLKNNSNNNEMMDNETFKDVCPAILYSLIIGGCTHQESLHNDLEDISQPYTNLYKWMYSLLAISLISACGILGLAVIPVMQKRFYQPLLQFLVSLAVGTLAGDALLHLLPHAMMSHSEKGHEEHHHGHDDNTWKGFVAMLGLIFFFFMERIIMLAAKWRRGEQLKEKLPSKLNVIKPEVSTQLTNAKEKQCKHKYSSFPYCYDEINMDMGVHFKPHEHIDTPIDVVHMHSNEHPNNFNVIKVENNESNDTNCSEINKMLSNEIHNKIIEDNQKDDTDSIEYTVILREHENRHHGHSHTHGHVHAAPKTMSSVAWMVIMGDGLHNFTDGMAIGAAFASSVTGGFSTAVAVFCHELPHELGDFAMLLKAGMSMRQALFYNLLSSVLCLFGNIFGLWLGNTEHASSWIFAVAAGMFLYIALVDMIPELSSGHEAEGTFMQCILHLGGLLLGFGIMALIALYEHDLKSMFRD